MEHKKRQLNELSIDIKKIILDKLERGISGRKLAVEFKVHHSTISNIKKRKEQILALWNANCSKDRKRKVKEGEHEEVNQICFKFLEALRAKNIPVSGPSIQTKAKSIAESFGDSEFQASNWWLQRFMERHNLSFRVMLGESSDMDLTSLNLWKNRLPQLLEGYQPRDVYNLDETGLFFKQLPSKTLSFKQQQCSGGKLAKERLTCLLACNMVKEKLRLLVIGKAMNPRAFRSAHIATKDLPVMWRSNKKAWMTSELFKEWLTLMNRVMKAGNRHVLFFLDNAPSHPPVELSNIKIHFLPPNMTAGAQPLDQGIIQAFKLHYRRHLMEKLLACAEICQSASDFTNRVSVLDAVRWIRKAWDEILPHTISSCFFRCGFHITDAVSDPTVASYDEITFSDTGNFNDLNAPLATIDWFEHDNLNDLISFDDALNVHDFYGDDADSILSSLLNQHHVSDTESDSEEVLDKDNAHPLPPPPTFSEALDHVETLTRYSATHDPSLLDYVFNLHSLIEHNYASVRISRSQQSTLHQFIH